MNTFRYLFFVIVAISTDFGIAPARGAGRCGDYYVKDCACPKGCTETLCQKLCKLSVDAYPRCGYECSSADCVCGAYGMNTSMPGVYAALCRLFAGEAEASETAASKNPGLPVGVEEVKTPHGDYIVTDETLRQGDGAEAGSGIGVLIGKVADGMAIKKVLVNSPAERAGLREGDTITAIDLGAAALGPTRTMALKDAIESLRGKPGSMVVLQIRKKKTKKIVKVSIIRTSDALASPKEFDKSISRIPLESLKAKECPKTHEGCFLLFPSDGDCVFTCSPGEK